MSMHAPLCDDRPSAYRCKRAAGFRQWPREPDSPLRHGTPNERKLRTIPFPAAGRRSRFAGRVREPAAPDQRARCRAAGGDARRRRRCRSVRGAGHRRGAQRAWRRRRRRWRAAARTRPAGWRWRPRPMPTSPTPGAARPWRTAELTQRRAEIAELRQRLQTEDGR